MNLSPMRLGAWWPPAVLLVIGVAVVGLTGRLVLGGGFLTFAFALAAGLRAWLPEHRAGGLHIRSKAIDVLFYTAAAIDVAGAILLVTHHIRPRAVAAANIVLAVALVWQWWKAIMRYHGPRRPETRPAA